LRAGTPSVRLATLWAVQEHRLTGPECQRAVAERLDDRDEDVATEAVRALAVFGDEAAPAVPRPREALWVGGDEKRAAAARTLGALGLQVDAVVADLCGLLTEHSPAVVGEAAAALGRLGRPAPTAVAPLLAALETALVGCDDALAGACAQA